MKSPAEIEAGLSQFTGTENYYRAGVGKLLYTDGVKYLADAAEAHWLIDAIASYQPTGLVHNEGFQVWILTKDETDQAYLRCYSDYDASKVTVANWLKYGLAEQHIPLTNFPLSEIKIWVEGGPEQPVALLPSEH